jgi:hypothetical protein
MMREMIEATKYLVVDQRWTAHRSKYGSFEL